MMGPWTSWEPEDTSSGAGLEPGAEAGASPGGLASLCTNKRKVWFVRSCWAVPEAEPTVLLLLPGPLPSGWRGPSPPAAFFFLPLVFLGASAAVWPCESLLSSGALAAGAASCWLGDWAPPPGSRGGAGPPASSSPLSPLAALRPEVGLGALEALLLAGT